MPAPTDRSRRPSRGTAGVRGLKRVEVERRAGGRHRAVAGIEDIHIGDTIADLETPKALPRIRVDEPTIKMGFTVNNSPFAGKEGKWVTSRQVRDRLSGSAVATSRCASRTPTEPDTFAAFGPRRAAARRS